MLGQRFPVVLGQHAGRAAVDELVQIGRVPPDGARGHPKVGAALLDPCEDAPANRIHVQIVFVKYHSRWLGSCPRYSGDAPDSSFTDPERRPSLQVPAALADPVPLGRARRGVESAIRGSFWRNLARRLSPHLFINLEYGKYPTSCCLALPDKCMFDIPGMETLTEPFERCIADFLRRTRLTPSEFGERAIGGRQFCGCLRRGRSPTLRIVDRVLAFMESFDRASMGVNCGSRPGRVEAHGEAERHAGRWDGPLAPGSMAHR